MLTFSSPLNTKYCHEYLNTGLSNCKYLVRNINIHFQILLLMVFVSKVWHKHYKQSNKKAVLLQGTTKQCKALVEKACT